MILSALLFSTLFIQHFALPTPGRHPRTTHSTTSNTRWSPISGTTTTTHQTLSHSSSSRPLYHGHDHDSSFSNAVPSSNRGSGFNWGHAAVGAAAGVGAATLINQHNQINRLQDQVGSGIGGGMMSSSPVAVGAGPVAASNTAFAGGQPVAIAQAVPAAAPVTSGENIIHSEIGQELILNTDAGLKIFEQKN